MDKENLKVAADLCSDLGIEQSAKMMREMSEDGATAYLVVHHETEYNDETYYPVQFGTPKRLFFEKAKALEVAAQLNAKAIQQSNPFSFGYEPGEVLTLSTAEFEAQVSTILGEAFNLPIENDNALWDFETTFFDQATPEQMLEISKLFKIQHYTVVESNFVA